MDYAQDNGKVLLIDSPYTLASQRLSITDDPEIRRTRRILLITFGVLLVLAALGTVSSIAGNRITNNSKYSSDGVEIGRSLISVVFFSFGYLVAHRYSKIGLLVFAWLSIIGLVIGGIVVVQLLIVGLTFSTNARSINNSQTNGMLVGASTVFFVVIVIFVVASIIQIVIVRFAFKLAKLIEVKKSSFRQQI
ncbi:unnamed protein product [Rotaria magnacalcarata]|uniref:Uncharacterized protein n=1 Tax=Rotaria magnacalcarata TaxID=392030 RepID=A0A816NFD7_9BILA|nr:unnamed protein product [Rotaria magnacalcarata]CAF1632091.1 unnamed protein product [Rotaria magnacalcarata]CAF2025366.1 unnamed protein product [Rotaria magnacalcarata]CAF2058365.1 unnamed protein product [Rotaria magnacalcarata]CAF2097099.1 unnamed protein product [Rotaria magnacalcarata]